MASLFFLKLSGSTETKTRRVKDLVLYLFSGLLFAMLAGQFADMRFSFNVHRSSLFLSSLSLISASFVCCSCIHEHAEGGMDL